MAKKTEKAPTAVPTKPKAAVPTKLDIKIGSMVLVKVVKEPSSDRATKTLTRILNKDRAAHKAKEHLQKLNIRSQRSKRRGGRWYELNVRKRTLVDGGKGESGVVKATMDVIADLNSVARFIEVKPAPASKK